MTGIPNGPNRPAEPARLVSQTRRSGRVRRRSLLIRLARSRVLEKTMMVLVTLVIIVGMVLTTGGMIGEISGFSSKMTRLAQIAGGGDAVFSSTLDLVQSSILELLGVASPVSADQEVTLPDTGNLTPTPTPFLPNAPGAGFVPFQVELNQPPELAPTLVRPEAAASTETPAPGETPAPTATPGPLAEPGWLVIQRIGLEAPVIVSNTKMVEVGGQVFAQWEAPNMFAAGWQEGSAPLGVPGNTVLNGHHNIYGEVFGHLYELNQGDEIIVYSGDKAFHYAVTQVMKIEERNATLQQRQENARWVMPSTDERLTLVTCWPPTNNTFRLIVVAVPVK